MSEQPIVNELKQCKQYVDELHQLFQYIEVVTFHQMNHKTIRQAIAQFSSKGFLSLDQLTTFQELVFKSHGLPATKEDQNYLIVNFIRNVHKSNKNTVEWPFFLNTVTEFVARMTDFQRVIADTNGNLSQADRSSLHYIVMAFFMQGCQQQSRVKQFDLLKEAHYLIEIAERDIADLNIYGVNQIITALEPNENGELVNSTLMQSKALAANMTQVIQCI